LFLSLPLAVLLITQPAAAQWEELHERGGESQQPSPFQLFGDRDFAASGLRMKGDVTGCTENTGDLSHNDYCWNRFNRRSYMGWHGIYFYVAAPPSERDKQAELVPSLLNANNRGYTVNSWLSQYTGETLPADGTFGIYHSGVPDSGSGDCLDFLTVGTGTPLLAASDCEATWGSLGWQGSRPITRRGYLGYADQVGDLRFSFDPWRVREEFHENDSFLGHFQTYGFFQDYSTEALFGSATHPRYGNVVPGGVGPSTRAGWPLGMFAKMDAFSFDDMNLRNIAFYQVTVTNNSRDVYGVPLDYDSLYMGFNPGWHGFGDGVSLYRDPANGVVRGATFCQGFTNSSSQGTSGNGCGPGGDPMHPASSWGTAPPEGIGAGFNYGASALIIMKSPIGDLRNKLLSDPNSAFFAKGDPSIWDDTITFSHGHMCGFHGCSAVIWNAPGSISTNADYEQRQFGMVSSITRDVMGRRNIADISQHVMWDTWRWEEFPDVNQLDFNKWVPGLWDYNDDGIPDTLFYDDCSDKGGPQYDPFTGNAKRCAVAWSDTLPGGFGNLYSGRGAVMGVGPFSFPADSTVQWVVAVVHGNDLDEIESGISWSILSYMNFYVSVDRAPPPAITSVDVASGGEGLSLPNEPEARLTFYLDDATEAWQDPWLEAWLGLLQSAPPASALGSLRALNPWVVDTVQALIPNNVAAIHVFKSCDGGFTYTDDDDCEPDPAVEGEFAQLGWYPWLTLEPDASGDVSNTFVDDGAFTGQTFLYSLVTQTRGLTVPVTTGIADTAFTADGDTVIACVQDCATENLTIAPVLYSALTSVTTEPQVASLYVPVSRQAGAVPVTFEVMQPSPDFLPIERMGLQAAGEEVDDGEYRLVFSDQVTVKEYYRVAPGIEELQRTTVEVAGELFESPGEVGVEGQSVDSIVGDQLIRTYSFGRYHRGSWISYFTAVLLDIDDVPLMVTSDLNGGQTVPGRYFGIPNFPGFTVRIDNTIGGTFEGQFYTDPNGEVVGPLIEPAVTYRHSFSSRGSEGRYRITWTDQAFGPASPFTLNFFDPAGTREAIVASLEAREAGTTASTDDETASWVGLDLSHLLAVRLPFIVENVTDPANPFLLRAVMTRDMKDTILIVGSGLDTLRVVVPETEWIPGDEIMLFSGTGQSMQPEFVKAIIGCDATFWLRISCNPVALQSQGATGYVPNGRDYELDFSYYQTITSETEYTFEARSAVSGNELLRTDPASVAAALDSVKVVPNPFVLFSRHNVYSQHEFILFTHVPPRGRVRIYTVAGQFVQLLRWGPNDLNGQGDLRLYLLTREGNEFGAGLYLYVMEAMDEAGNSLGVKRGKFVIIW
jgi:hypothetical protein